MCVIKWEKGGVGKITGKNDNKYFFLIFEVTVYSVYIFLHATTDNMLST